MNNYSYDETDYDSGDEDSGANRAWNSEPGDDDWMGDSTYDVGDDDSSSYEPSCGEDSDY